MGTAGRKRASGARGWSEGRAESEKAKEKKRRNKTIAEERGTGKNEEASEGSGREKAICCMTGRIEAIPRWQRIEKRLERRERAKEKEKDREREKERTRGRGGYNRCGHVQFPRG